MSGYEHRGRLFDGGFRCCSTGNRHQIGKMIFTEDF